MADNKLEIVLTLVDEASDKLKDFSEKIKSFGKTVSSAGQATAFFGAGLSGPFLLAIKNSSEHSSILKIKIDSLKTSFEDLQVRVATAVIPIIDRFSGVLNQLNSYILSLNPQLVNTALQATFLTGIFLTVGGTIAVIIGKVITLSGNLIKLLAVFGGFAAANTPILVIAGSIVLLTTLMLKFKSVADVVLGTFQVLFLLLKNGFEGIVLIVEMAVRGLLENIQWIIDMMAKIPGPTRDLFQNLSNEIQGVISTLDFAIQQSAQNIQTNTNTIGQIFETGVGTWSQSFDKFKIKIADVIGDIKNLGTVTQSATKTSRELWLQQANGVQSALSAMSGALTQAAAENKKFAVAAKVSAIGLAIVNTAVGVTNALAVPPPWLGLALAAIMGAAGAIQIATIASTPMAEGGIVNRPTHALIGEAGPEAVIPLSKSMNLGNTQNIHIEINNPIVRSDEDIDKLTEEISLRLAREAERL